MSNTMSVIFTNSVILYLFLKFIVFYKLCFLFNCLFFYFNKTSCFMRWVYANGKWYSIRPKIVSVLAHIF
jgi:hypothetical protein